MAPYYENIETGIRSYHPVSGLGKTFNAIEIEEDGKPVKPKVAKGASKTAVRKAANSLKDRTKTPSQATEAKTGTGDSIKKQEGDQ